MANVFTARGEQAKESMEQKKIDLKNAYYRFKSGESAKVRVLSTMDYVEYSAHSSFTHKIYTQPCIAVIGQECALCKASKSGIEEYEGLYARKRYIFVFGDMATGELKAVDVSKNQAKKLIADIEEYKDEINDIAFTLRKTGEGTNTGYSLSPILKMKGDEPTQFETCGMLEVTDEYLNTILSPRTREMQIKALQECGFPVKDFFKDAVVDGDEFVNVEEETEDLPFM